MISKLYCDLIRDGKTCEGDTGCCMEHPAPIAKSCDTRDNELSCISVLYLYFMELHNNKFPSDLR